MVEFEFDVDWARAAWIAFGAVLVAALLVVGYAFVGTFVFGLFIYYATRRLYRRVRRRIGPPSVAAAASLLLLALPALALLTYTLVVAVSQLSAFTEGLNGASDQLQPLLDLVGPYAGEATGFPDPATVLTGIGAGTISTTLESAAGYLAVLGVGLLHLFVMLALAFYLLRDGPRFNRWLRNFTDQRGVLDQYLREVDRSLDKVFYGNILNAIITGIVGAITFSLLQYAAPTEAVAIPYPALVGLLTGVASLIPVVGMKLVYVPLAIYMAIRGVMTGEGLWFVGMFALVAFVIVDTIPDLLVRPYVSGGTLHTGALMFAYILGPLIWGWYGIFLGPMLLVLVVHFARIVAPELLSHEPIRPYAVDPGVLGPGETDGPADATGAGTAPDGSGETSPDR
ncbi:AI-2E family transporter [Halomicrobium salinisoli]|uniref:AI-2E family transporter n=1 Tax=Halomicrobium salinisoli TaxID=2878391 RepID=UPI001CF04ABC|nr:AI-2E family transporter [Halomicrobium salinisoli]